MSPGVRERAEADEAGYDEAPPGRRAAEHRGDLQQALDERRHVADAQSRGMQFDRVRCQPGATDAEPQEKSAGKSTN